MTSSQKAAVSFLCAILIFAVFAVAAFAGLFSFIETQFYQPVLVNSINQKLDSISSDLNEYIEILESRFSVFTKAPAVVNCVQPVQSDSDIKMRTELAGTLLSETPGLIGIRLIDTAGRRIHYSTFESDVYQQRADSVSFKNYENTAIPYNLIENRAADGSRVIFDSASASVIFTFPFYDSYKAYRGTMLFYVQAADFTRFLSVQHQISLSDSGYLVAPPLAQETADSNVYSRGFVFGLPVSGKDILAAEILKKWQNGLFGTEPLIQTPAATWVLLTGTNSAYGCTAWVYPEAVFLFSDTVKAVLLVCVFITLFLIIFLLFNIKRDDMVVIKDRIRRVQIGLINEYLEKKQEIDWNKISAEITSRRHEVSAEIKKSLGHRARRNQEVVNTLLDKSWNEILSALGKPAQQAPAALPAGTTTEELKQMLEQIISSGNITVRTVKENTSSGGTEPAAPSAFVRTPEPEELEEIAEAEPADLEPEEMEEIQELGGAEEIEELEEITEAEPADLEPEEMEEIQELGGAEEIEELEEIAEAEPADLEAQESDAVNKMQEISLEDFGFEDISESDGQIPDTEESASDKAAVQIEQVDISDFEQEEIPKIGKELFAEPLSFGMPQQPVYPCGNSFDPAQFEVAVPDFSDEDMQEKTEEEKPSDEDVPLAEEIADEIPFSFTMFSSKKTILEFTEAEEPAEAEAADAIVERDGLFSIANRVETSAAKIDPDFKKLVDSVLK